MTPLARSQGIRELQQLANEGCAKSLGGSFKGSHFPFQNALHTPLQLFNSAGLRVPSVVNNDEHPPRDCL